MELRARYKKLRDIGGHSANVGPLSLKSSASPLVELLWHPTGLAKDAGPPVFEPTKLQPLFECPLRTFFDEGSKEGTGLVSATRDFPPESFIPRILSADPPDHTWMRGLMNRSFTPGRVVRPPATHAPHGDESERSGRAQIAGGKGPGCAKNFMCHIESSLKQVRSASASFLPSCADRDHRPEMATE